MGLLKSIAKLNPSAENRDKEADQIKEDKKVTFYESGLKDSKSCTGNPHNLEISFKAIYEKFERDCKENIREQELLKTPYVTEQKGKKTTILNKTEEKKRIAEKIKNETEKIKNLEIECRNVKAKPEEYLDGIDKRASAKFWMGLIFLLPLTVYIFIFYISTAYSAFFREFSLGEGLVQGMFYPQALTKAYEASILELGFVIFIPFVFFGLGFLLHMFQEKKSVLSYFKIGVLVIITFIFDAILAYLIDKKLYDLTKTFDSPMFNLKIAFTSVDFWVIIFAGFVSYLIWGFVFDVVMKENEQRDKIKTFLKNKKEEIDKHKKEINKLKEIEEAIEKEIGKLNVRITELQNIIDGFVLPVMNYKSLSTEYLQGWMEFISSELHVNKTEKDKILVDCKEVYKNHLNSLDINTDTYQNKIYKKTL
jgi:hypothetical protein